MVEGTIFSGWSMAASLLSLSSGTGTMPVLGSIVQNGKFSAAMPALVNALKSVDLPTLGRPTIPQLNPIFLNLLDKSKVPFVRDFLEICILLSWEPWQQGSLRRLPPDGTRLFYS